MPLPARARTRAFIYGRVLAQNMRQRVEEARKTCARARVRRAHASNQCLKAHGFSGHTPHHTTARNARTSHFYKRLGAGVACREVGRIAESVVREGLTAVKSLASAFARGVREEIARELERREAEAAAAARR